MNIYISQRITQRLALLIIIVETQWAQNGQTSGATLPILKKDGITAYLLDKLMLSLMTKRRLLKRLWLNFSSHLEQLLQPKKQSFKHRLKSRSYRTPCLQSKLKTEILL